MGPLFVPMMISNMAAGNVSIHFGLKGKSINVVTACATGTNTIGEAFRAIQYGEADIMVSREEPREVSVRPAIAGFTALTALISSKPIRRDVPFRLIKNAAALSWERAQRWSCWRNWSMQNAVAQEYMQRLWVMAVLRRCVSYHISGRRWQRRSKSYVKCCSGCRDHSG